MNGSAHTLKASLSHTITRLIVIRVRIDHEDDKTLLQSTTTFPIFTMLFLWISSMPNQVSQFFYDILHHFKLYLEPEK